MYRFDCNVVSFKEWRNSVQIVGGLQVRLSFSSHDHPADATLLQCGGRWIGVRCSRIQYNRSRPKSANGSAPGRVWNGVLPNGWCGTEWTHPEMKTVLNSAVGPWARLTQSQTIWRRANGGRQTQDWWVHAQDERAYRQSESERR